MRFVSIGGRTLGGAHGQSSMVGSGTSARATAAAISGTVVNSAAASKAAKRACAVLGAVHWWASGSGIHRVVLSASEIMRAMGSSGSTGPPPR